MSNNWIKTVYLIIGIGLVAFQSIFLTIGLTVIWAAAAAWRIEDPWWMLFLIGLITDIFHLSPLGRTSLILIAVGLLVKYFKNILGFSESYKMKLKNF